MTDAHVVRRVPLGFNWPVGDPWHGYVNPWPGPEPCRSCGVSGFNPETKRLLDRFNSWAPRMTRGEEKTLLSFGFGKAEIRSIRSRKGRWNPILCEALLEERSKRLGVYGLCSSCDGEGYRENSNPAVARIYAGVNLFREWEPTEPPMGEGWQLWTEGKGPKSPVFDSAEELARWCSEAFRKAPPESWLTWVERSTKGVPPPRPPFRLPSDHLRTYTIPVVRA